MIKYYLTQDIVGSSSRITFGKKGDQVRVYSDHDNIKIVENEGGFRFAVHENHLTRNKVEPEINTAPVEKQKKRR